MLALMLWWASIALEALLLMRAAGNKLHSLYPIFYSYLAWVLAADVARFFVYSAHRNFYQHFYWYTQFPTIILGYGVLVEIYRRTLQNYAGAGRLARAGLLGTLGIVLFNVFLHGVARGFQPLAITTEELERNLRTVQALLIFVLAGVLLYYSVPIGRNLKGLLLGYSLFVSASVIDMALTWHLERRIFHQLWQYLYSAAYLFALVVWCLTLWSYQPNPEPEIQPLIEHDYGVLAESTKRVLVAARGYLLRAVRP
ncbi:MAG: hypothetical protein WBC04_06545 [Candidatus Acidiferrales bacterium]